MLAGTMKETNSDARWLRRLVLACSTLGVVGLGACRDNLTAPLAGPTFDNHGGDRHDEHDGRGIGRSGSAAMTVSATLLADGSTELTVTTFAASDLDFSEPVGCIKKVQVKVLNGNRHHDEDDDDDRTWTRNFNNLNVGNSYTVRLTNVSLGAQIKVKVLVGCIDRRRTDVVTATGVVVSKPVDLGVTAIRGPGNWPVNVAATILADVSESLGQQAASATCVLYVDDGQVASVPVSVIAGGTSTCTFTRTFTAVKSYELKVAVANTRPLDVNASNDSKLGRIDINTANTGGTPSLPVFNYTADVGDITIDEYDETRTTTWLGDATTGALPVTTLGPNTDVSVTRKVVGREQTSVFSGVYYGQLTFGTVGIGLSLSQSVGTAGSLTSLDDSGLLSGLGANGTGGEPCYKGGNDAGVTYEVCYHAAGFTTLQYSRTTSLTTVSQRTRVDHLSGCASSSYPTITSDEAATGTYLCYVVNETAAVGSLPAWSTQLSFSVALATGGVSYSASPSITLGTLNEPPTPDNTTCTTTTTPSVYSPGSWGIPEGWTRARTVQTCIRSWLTRTGTVGSATGIGVTVPLQ